MYAGRHPGREPALQPGHAPRARSHDAWSCPSGTGKIGIRSRVRPHVGVGLHPLGDQQRGVARAGDLRVPQRPHLGGGLEVVAVAVELEAGGIRQRLAGLHAQQRLVVVRGLAGDVVAVVGGQRRDAELAADLEQALTDPALDVEAVVHQLEEEVVRRRRSPATWRPTSSASRSWPSRSRVCTSPDGQPVVAMMPAACSAMSSASIRDHLPSWPSNEASERQLEQVAQTGRVLGDHRHVGVGAATGDVVALLARVAPQDALGVEPGRGRDVGLDTDDRLDARPRWRCCRTRWRRTCFRGRSCRSPASPAAAPRRASA